MLLAGPANLPARPLRRQPPFFSLLGVVGQPSASIFFSPRLRLLRQLSPSQSAVRRPPDPLRGPCHRTRTPSLAVASLLSSEAAIRISGIFDLSVLHD